MEKTLKILYNIKRIMEAAQRLLERYAAGDRNFRDLDLFRADLNGADLRSSLANSRGDFVGLDVLDVL